MDWGRGGEKKQSFSFDAEEGKNDDKGNI